MLTPRGYQAKAIAHLQERFLAGAPGLVDASDLGCGKTLVATEVSKWSQRNTLVVCPKSVIPSWQRHAELQGNHKLRAINWELARTGNAGFGHWVSEGNFEWNNEIKFLILDESHLAKSPTSKNAAMVCAARRQGIPSLALSGTLADSPLELCAVGYLVGLHDGFSRPTLRKPNPDNFWQWARRHGCRPGPFRDWVFAGKKEAREKHMRAIHAELFPSRGVRVRVEDIGDEFPETQITAELFNLGDADAINKLEEQMAIALAELRAKIATDKFTDCRVEILRLRQEIELLKVPGLVELARDAEASGNSVVIFVNFTATINELSTLLDTDCIIDGRQVGERGAAEREANRTRFQKNESHFIICNTQAGGVGLDLHDVAGRPRTALLFPGYNAKDLRQALGRIHRFGGKSKSVQRILGAAGTVDEKVIKAIAKKLSHQEILNDGDLFAVPEIDFESALKTV